ncbi:ATP-binding protein [Acidovorax sp. CCYZU-2555]|uniref:ATP-binding protein n=1 Tax=Acidovorax sp. CCYZU-2555 TaxID=2835042 RepID=UPI0032DF41D5
MRVPLKARWRLRPAWLHWPSSMAHQLGLLLLVGALATHGIAILFLQQVGALVHPISQQQVLERHAVAQALVLHGDPAQPSAGLRAMHANGQRVWVSDQAEVAPHAMQAEELAMAALLRERLGLASTTAVWVQLERIDGGPARDQLLALRQWSALQMRISIALPDGRWLNSWQLPSGGYEWWQMLRFSLPVSILPVLLIGYLFVRRILRPVKALVHATGHLGRGERVENLPVVGPREARELTAAFNRMQHQLLRFVQDRTRMLAAIGHDFRTPITSLRLQAALVDDPQLREDMIETLTDMRTMVEETLNFARDDAAEEPTEVVDPWALLESVARPYRLTSPCPVQLVPLPADAVMAVFRGRPVSLKRALSNLVDNAVRHGGQARVAIAMETQGPEPMLCIHVEDEGPGIDPALLEKVFAPFFRADPARNQERSAGLGLGLAIARTCAHAHGGDVVLTPRAPTGLRASLRLPL